jgi:hypothetical protein
MKKKELPMCSKDLDNLTYGLLKKPGRYSHSSTLSFFNRINTPSHTLLNLILPFKPRETLLISVCEFFCKKNESFLGGIASREVTFLTRLVFYKVVMLVKRLS